MQMYVDLYMRERLGLWGQQWRLTDPSTYDGVILIQHPRLLSQHHKGDYQTLLVIRDPILNPTRYPVGVLTK